MVDEEQALLNVSSNSTIYQNVPPTLVTKPIQTSKKHQHQSRLPLSIEAKSSRTTTAMNSLSSFHWVDENKPSPFVDPKWDKIRRKIKLINRNTGINVISDIINDILVAKEINYVNLTKGKDKNQISRDFNS